MKIIPKNSFWAIPVTAALLFFLNIFIQEGIDKLRFKEKKIPYALAPRDNNNAPKRENMPADELREKKVNDFPPLELRGTIIGNPSLAFIYNANTNSQKVYKLNETIADYKIMRIAQAKVTLVNGGAVKELLISGKSRKNEADTPVLYSETDGTMIISRSGIRKKIIPAANELLAKLRILPMPGASKEKLKGFRIDNVPSGSVVDSAGIKNGDIIHSIEGQQLTSMRQAWLMFDQIKTQPRFEVVVLRGDKPVTLRYRMGD